MKSKFFCFSTLQQLLLLLLLLQSRFMVKAKDVVVQSLSGSISSFTDPSTSKYSNLANDSWLFNSSQKLFLTFTKFDVESCCDFVLLYDSINGKISDKPKFSLSSRDDANSEFFLQGPVRIQFTSNEAITGEGFTADYQFFVYDKFTISSQIFLSPTAGIVKSHAEYPENYTIGLMKVLSFVVKPHSRIRIKFLSPFDLHSPNDVVQVFSGIPPKIAANPLLELSGNNLKNLNSLTSYRGNVTIAFRSGNQGTGKGFQFEYQIISDSTLTQANGFIISKTNPKTSKYFINSNESWLINITAPIKVHFTEFHLESCCSQVKLYDTDKSNSAMRLRFVLNEIESGRSEYWLQGPVIVKFVSDSGNAAKGFQLKYERVNLSDSLAFLTEPSNSSIAIVRNLNLVMLYQFGKYGLKNIANPGFYTLRNTNVRINSSGAHFDKNSKLEVSTPGFENIVGADKKYSMFISVKNKYISFTRIYAWFATGSEYDLVLANFFNLIHINYKNRITNQESSLGSEYRPNTMQLSTFSTGFTFNGTDAQEFYLNGNFYGTSSPRRSFISATQGPFYQKLILGGYPGYEFVGTMYCFGLSSRIISLGEYQQLDNWCRDGS